MICRERVCVYVQRCSIYCVCTTKYLCVAVSLLGGQCFGWPSSVHTSTLKWEIERSAANKTHADYTSKQQNASAVGIRMAASRVVTTLLHFDKQ